MITETHVGVDPGHGGLATHRGSWLSCSAPDCVEKVSDVRHLVRATVADLALVLVAYDRKEDEQLTQELLFDLLQTQVVLAEDLVVWFSEALRTCLDALGVNP